MDTFGGREGEVGSGAEKKQRGTREGNAIESLLQDLGFEATAGVVQRVENFVRMAVEEAVSENDKQLRLELSQRDEEWARRFALHEQQVAARMEEVVRQELGSSERIRAGAVEIVTRQPDDAVNERAVGAFAYLEGLSDYEACDYIVSLCEEKVIDVQHRYRYADEDDVDVVVSIDLISEKSRREMFSACFRRSSM